MWWLKISELSVFLSERLFLELKNWSSLAKIGKILYFSKQFTISFINNLFFECSNFQEDTVIAVRLLEQALRILTFYNKYLNIERDYITDTSTEYSLFSTYIFSIISFQLLSI